MIFLLSLSIAIAFAVILNSIFGYTGRVAAWLRLFLLGWAHIILNSQICGALSILTTISFLFIQCIMLLAALWVYKKFGQPGLFSPYAIRGQRFPPVSFSIPTAILGVGIGLVYAFNLVLSFFIPQNNYDSLTYHLARVGYWVQHHALVFWDTPNIRQTSFPPNAELGILWGVLLSGSDRFSGLVQWTSALACMVAIFGIARLLRATIPQAGLAALLWASMPQVVLQSVTTQNDLVVSGFLTSAVFFLHSGAQNRRRLDLVFSGAALGLAFGTKTTIFFALPGFCLAALFWFWPGFKQTGRLFAAWLGYCTVGFILLGGMVYLQNWSTYQNPLGPAAEGEGSTTVSSRLALLGQNTSIYAYQLIDFSGLPSSVAGKLVSIKAQITEKVLRKLRWSFATGVYSTPHILYLPPRIHEDFSWFGPVLWLGFLPAWVVSLWTAFKHRRMDLLTYLLMGALFLVVISMLIGWTPHKSRYFIPCVALTAPLFFLMDRPWLRAYTSALILLSLSVVLSTTVTNEARPLIGSYAVWRADALTLRTMNMPQMKMVVETVDAHVPAEARLALQLGENGADYLFFGSGLRRELIQVDHLIQREGVNGLKSVQADYLLVGPRQQFFYAPPPGLELVGQENNATLYRIDQSLIGSESHKRTEPFPESDPQRLVFVAPELNLDVAVMETWIGSWEIDQLDGNGFYWFGQGEPQGLGMKIWSEVELDASLRIRIQPGPSRLDPARTLAVVPSINNQREKTQVYSFSSPTELLVPIHLRPGVNEIGFFILEPADVAVQPNGDLRQLLARLDRMTIEPRP